jgi:hypothetical protein
VIRVRVPLKKDREDRPERGQSGGASANPEHRTKRREDRAEGGQQGGTRPRQDERQRRKDPETGRPGEATLQQGVRTRVWEDPEEEEDSPQQKLIRKKPVRNQGGSSAQAQPQVTPVVGTRPEEETGPTPTPPQEYPEAGSGYMEEDTAPGAP